MIDWIRESNLIEDIDDHNEDIRSCQAWRWFRRQGELTPGNILKVHRRITIKQLPHGESGHFRKCQVWVGGREGAPWQQVPELIDKWLEKWTMLPPFPVLQYNQMWFQRSHVEFEKIHPFIDGNGRTGRMIMNWQREHAGLEPLLISASKRGAYYSWFM